MITVITPATGHPRLRYAIRSVQNQLNVEYKHLIVIDGADRQPAVEEILEETDFRGNVLVAPEPTGSAGYNGHLIYLTMPFLTRSEYVAFLDEDNVYADNHLTSLEQLCRRHDLDWAYSLRRVFSDDHAPLEDNCQSLGWWAAYNGPYHLIDTSCYFLKREVANAGAAIWNRERWTPPRRAPDCMFCSWLLHHHPRGFTSSKYTLDYWLGPEGFDRDRRYDFFKFGNSVYTDVYRRFPWRAYMPSDNGCGENMLFRCADLAFWHSIKEFGKETLRDARPGEITTPLIGLARPNVTVNSITTAAL